MRIKFTYLSTITNHILNTLQLNLKRKFIYGFSNNDNNAK